MRKNKKMESNSYEKKMKRILCSDDEVIEVDVLTLSKLSPVIRNKLGKKKKKKKI